VAERFARRLRATIAAATLIGSCAVALGQDLKEVTFEGEANSLAVGLQPGELLRVRLQAQPSAGYSWRLLSADQSIVALVETSFVRPDADARKGSAPQVGAPAEQVFVLKAQTTGATEVVFVYGRPWETEKPPQRTARLSVKVGP
jgi:predicted secreted protein